MLRLSSLALVTTLLAGGVAAADTSTQLGRPLVTYYWIVDEDDARYAKRAADVTLRDVRGKVIARTSKRFKRDLTMEGTGRLRSRDGRTVTYVKSVSGDPRFRVTHAKYGNGIGRCHLVPYRTLAVDPNFIPLGTRVYVPAFKGAILPDGSVHDGMFTANDRGPFRGSHIDVFTGVGPGATRPFNRIGVRSRSRVAAYLSKRPDPDGCHKK